MTGDFVRFSERLKGQSLTRGTVFTSGRLESLLPVLSYPHQQDTLKVVAALIRGGTLLASDHTELNLAIVLDQTWLSY